MEPPMKPSESDCCNSGCNPCILDIYEIQLRKYERSIANNEAIVPKNNCISQTSYTVFELTKIDSHTCDTLLLTFQASLNPDSEAPKAAVVYKPGQHFLIKGHSPCDKNDQFTRPYTPIPVGEGASKNSSKFVVLVKLYEDGCMSEYIKSLRVGTKTLWRGPYGDFELAYNLERMLLIAQGTGVAPLFAVIKDVLANFDCDTFLKLYFCCRTDKDILLRDELYALTSFWNFSYEVFLSNSNSASSKYNEVIYESRLSFEHLNKYFGSCNRDKVHVLVCGSKVFNENMLNQLIECGVSANKVFLFYNISLLSLV